MLLCPTGFILACCMLLCFTVFSCLALHYTTVFCYITVYYKCFFFSQCIKQIYHCIRVHPSIYCCIISSCIFKDHTVLFLRCIVAYHGALYTVTSQQVMLFAISKNYIVFACVDLVYNITSQYNILWFFSMKYIVLYCVAYYSTSPGAVSYHIMSYTLYKPSIHCEIHDRC